MIQVCNADKILWQETGEETVPEQPILIRFYSGNPQVELRQREQSILIDLPSMRELINELKRIDKVWRTSEE